MNNMFRVLAAAVLLWEAVPLLAESCPPRGAYRCCPPPHWRHHHCGWRGGNRGLWNADAITGIVANSLCIVRELAIPRQVYTAPVVTPMPIVLPQSCPVPTPVVIQPCSPLPAGVLVGPGVPAVRYGGGCVYYYP